MVVLQSDEACLQEDAAAVLRSLTFNAENNHMLVEEGCQGGKVINLLDFDGGFGWPPIGVVQCIDELTACLAALNCKRQRCKSPTFFSQ